MNERILKLSLHHGIIDRDVANKSYWIEGWCNVELTPQELVESIKLGYPYCPQLSGPRNAETFLASDIVSLDVDHGMTIEQALQHPIVQEHATILYTTVRHRSDDHRFRVIFRLPRTITDPREMSAVTRAIGLRLNGDPAVFDAAHVFFGNRNAEVTLWDQELSPELLDDLIAQGLDPPVCDTFGGEVVPNRSRLGISPDATVRLANGDVRNVSDLPPKTPLYCPFHSDQNPSAFSVTNKNDINGIHCSTCGVTYWPKNENDEPHDFYDFERRVREAAEYRATPQDSGPVDPSVPGLIGSTVSIVNGSPAPPELAPGITLIISEKGTGKTESLPSLVANSRSVLLIGHRRTLIRNICHRLNLNCYLDEAKHLSRYGICLDSLMKIPKDVQYETIVLDESEQVLAHFLSETLDRKSGRRDRIFVEFCRLISQARRVIALDADLGWVTFRTLSRICDGTKAKPIRIWLNENKPSQGKEIEIFDSEGHLIAEIHQAAADGKRCFITSNAKRKIERLSAVLAKRFPGKRQIVITSDTVNQEDVKNFIANPQKHAAEYDLIFTSPSLGTGVDITFPDEATLIDIVFGLFEGQLTTHFDFDQQLARVRQPGAVKVWITPQRFRFETNLDVVKRDIMKRSLFKNVLVGYNDDGEPNYVEDDPFIEMASLIQSEQRASKNNLKDNFIRYKEKQGFIVRRIAKDANLMKEGRSIQAEGKRLSDANHIQRILDAKSLTEGSYQGVKRAIEAGDRISEAVKAAYERTSLEHFYHRPASKELIELDDGGRYRSKVLLFELAFEMPDFADFQLNIEPSSDRPRFVVSETQRAMAIRQLLQLTPLMNDRGNLNTEVTIQHDDLNTFVLTMRKYKGHFETLLGIEVRSDIQTKPMQQLGRVLKLVGLKFQNISVKKTGGIKSYAYRLDSSTMKAIKAIMEARRWGTVQIIIMTIRFRYRSIHCQKRG